MTTLHREPRDIGWLKQAIKHLPDNFKIYFLGEDGIHEGITEIKIDENGCQVGLLAGGLEVEIEAILAQGRKIQACKVYREYTGASLKEAVDYINALQDKMNNMA